MPPIKNHDQMRKPRDVHWGVCVYLLNGPMTLEQIQNSYKNNPFPHPQQSNSYPRQVLHVRHLESLQADLAKLIQNGWVIQVGSKYTLTPTGFKQTNQTMQEAMSSLKSMGQKLHSFTQPGTASKVTLIVQLFMALIKLPAGWLSGSVGLLNDAMDTTLDLLSSLLVFLGVRFNKERIVSILLVVFMAVTGGFTLYEAVHRFFVPYVIRVDWFPFAAAILSTLVSLVLWTYQRYVGIKSGLMAFITESVDSRNHVIVAFGVTAGLFASLMRFGLLDKIVGLIVALLILWSAIELVVDLARSSSEGQLDLSRYGFWLNDVYSLARTRYLRNWGLNLVARRVIQNREELTSHVRQAVDFRDNPWMQAIGLDRSLASDPIIEQVIDNLFEQGLIIAQRPLILSEAGKAYLKKQSRHLLGDSMELEKLHLREKMGRE